MSSNTPNLNLILPERADYYNSGVHFENYTKLDQFSGIISQQLDEVSKKFQNSTINIGYFGIVGDGSITETTKLQSAINYCFENGLTLDLGDYLIRTNSFILKCNMTGNSSTILLNEGHNFTNFESDGSKKYSITYLGKGITFESDKSRYWASEFAGDSFVSGITKPEVVRKYGQRVYIGNKTATPNNILATGSSDQQNGTGFWNKDYAQWNSSTNLNLNDISQTFSGISDKSDTNILVLTNLGTSIHSTFVGFCIGLTIKGGYDIDLERMRFTRCKIGLMTTDGGTLPGPLADVNSKSTTLNIRKCLFEDISYFGIYGHSILQSYVDDNIYQPCKIANVFLYASDNVITKNYSEICYSSVYIGTNDAIDNVFDNNFNNYSYNTYAFYCRYGANNKFSNTKGKKAAFVAAAVRNCDFDSSFEITKDNAYFYTNGNSINRNKTKYCIFTVTGVSGTSITRELIESNRDYMISAVASSSGLFFNGTEEILSVETMTNGTHSFLGYYQIPTGNRKVVFLDTINFSSSPASFTRGDFRTNGQTITIKVVFNDGYA